MTRVGYVRSFQAWLRSAAPGARAVYHEGCLATDRRNRVDFPWLNDTAEAVLKADAAGYVMAAHQPAPGGATRYVALRLRRPLPD